MIPRRPYEYHCDACGKPRERIQAGINDPTLKKCPAQEAELRRIFGTGAAIIFKGSGFYETDYRSDAYKASAKADKEPSSGDKSDGGDKKTTTGSTESNVREQAELETKTSPKSKKTRVRKLIKEGCPICDRKMHGRQHCQAGTSFRFAAPSAS